MSNGKSLIVLASVLFLLFSFITEGGLAQEFIYAHATVITPKGVSIPVEVSDTPEKRSLGLGKRDKLEKGWGMLFVFERRIPHSFWMKNMLSRLTSSGWTTSGLLNWLRMFLHLKKENLPRSWNPVFLPILSWNLNQVGQGLWDSKWDKS